MSYLHIENLYKNKGILLFKECFATEKIHGSSAHLKWGGCKNCRLTLFPGGASYLEFEKLFDKEKLIALFTEKFPDREVTIFGEAYGGKMQGMRDTYGPDLKFIVFEIKIDEWFLNVSKAEALAQEFGLEFVGYTVIPATLEAIDAERDAPSIQAMRNLGVIMPREGIVLRPLQELTFNGGGRVIAKHKVEKFRETKSERPTDAEKLEVLSRAEEIVDEWLTEIRLDHVLDAFPNFEMKQIGDIIKAMLEDIERESSGEVENFKEARKLIGKRTAEMLKRRLKNETIL